MNLANTDLWVLACYFIAVLAISIYLGRNNNTTEEYFLGGRNFKGWVIGLSMVGTSISSITFLAYPADAFKTSWIRFLPNLMLPIALLFAAYFFLPFFRDGKTTSAYEFLERRFGGSIRTYAALSFLIAQLFRISTILYLLGLLVHSVTGLDVTTAIIFSGLFIAVYTVVGGINAVIWTDVMQTVVLLLGGIVCLAVIVMALPNGFADIFSLAAGADKLSFHQWHDGALTPTSWGLSLSEKTASMILLMGVVNWLTEFCANQNTVQRYCASKSTADARKGMLVFALSSIPIWAFYMFLGTALFAFFTVFPDPKASAMLAGTLKAEGILPYFIGEYLPAGVAGLVIAAALAAAMSSLDSSINSISTVSIIDIYKRYFAPNKADKHYLYIAWCCASFAAGMMVLGALGIYAMETKTIQDLGTIIVSLLSGGLLAIYLVAFFTKTGSARHVWVGIIITMVFSAWTLVSKLDGWPETLKLPFDLYYTGLMGNALMLAVLIITIKCWNKTGASAAYKQ